MVRLEEIMTREVLSTTPDTPVSEVARAMLRRGVGSAVLLDGSWVVGIVTERDVLRAAASGQDLTVAPVSAWATRDPVTADPEMEADRAAEVMLSQGFRHLPVVRGRELLGIVSLRDILSARIRRAAR